MIVLGAVLGYSLYHRHVGVHEAVATSTAGVVSLIPEGLVVLVSLTYAVAAARMARRGVLAQQLNAIESLASVEVLCVDKTGTLTEAALRVAEILPASGLPERALAGVLARFAASAARATPPCRRSPTPIPEIPSAVLSEVPVSARVEAGARSSWARPPIFWGRLSASHSERWLHSRPSSRITDGACSRWPPATSRSLGHPGEDPPPDAEPLGLVILAERLRPNVSQTIAFLLEQGVEVMVLSGDSPQTVAAIARDVGIPVRGVRVGADIPPDPSARTDWALGASVVGRISPEGKRDVVQALTDAGRYVAMLGDGVNDVLALKASRLAIAQGVARRWRAAWRTWCWSRATSRSCRC